MTAPARLARLVGALGPTLASAAPVAGQNPRPFSFEQVDFTPGCAPSAAFARLLALLSGGAPAGAGEAAFDEPLYNAVSGAVSHELRLRREVPWHGLRLIGIRLYHGIESGPYNLSLVFADGPERVREVWNARGWRLPPVGETRVMEDKAIHTAIGVGSEGRHTFVTCYTD